MKHLKLNFLFILIVFSGLLVLPNTTKANESQVGEIPEIVNQCKDLTAGEIESFTLRYNSLDRQKQTLLDKFIFESYGKKSLPYQKVHLEMMMKVVESYSSEKTKESLDIIRKASGQ